MNKKDPELNLSIKEDELIRIIFDDVQNRSEMYSATTKEKWKKVLNYFDPELAEAMRKVDRAYLLFERSAGQYASSIPQYGIYHSTAIINPLNDSGEPLGHPYFQMIRSSSSNHTYTVSYDRSGLYDNNEKSMTVDLAQLNNHWVISQITYNNPKTIYIGHYGSVKVSNAKELLSYHERTLKDVIEYVKKNPDKLKTPEEMIADRSWIGNSVLGKKAKPKQSDR
jgi:hypothetical protein